MITKIENPEAKAPNSLDLQTVTPKQLTRQIRLRGEILARVTAEIDRYFHEGKHGEIQLTVPILNGRIDRWRILPAEQYV